MKKVTVIGIGINADTLTFEAAKAIKSAQVLAGARRVLDLVSDIYKDAPIRLYPYYLPSEISGIIAAEDAERFAVLVSGDVGFYSAAAGLASALNDCGVNFIPGVSTVNAFFARLQLPWQDAAFVSAHGRETDIAGFVRRNRFSFALTGNNAGELGAKLSQCGFGAVKIYVGENLGAKQERIYETVAEDLTRKKFPPLTVLLFQNDEFDDRTPIGLPDGGFLRLDGIPMTKSETRAVVMSKLNLKPTAVCFDIGAGTGSVTVEMALAAYRGHIYAVERKKEAVCLILKNCAAFHIGNVKAINGEAPAAIEGLPAPDAVFIGGGGRKIGHIIKTVWNKNPNARVVITAVSIETVQTALAAFKDAAANYEIVQISAARANNVRGLHIMQAQNPITVFCAGGKP